MSDRTPEDVIAEALPFALGQLTWLTTADILLAKLRDAGYTLVKDATEERRGDIGWDDDDNMIVERESRVVGPWVRITEGDNDD